MFTEERTSGQESLETTSLQCSNESSILKISDRAKTRRNPNTKMPESELLPKSIEWLGMITSSRYLSFSQENSWSRATYFVSVVYS